MKDAIIILTFLVLVGCGGEQVSTNDQLQFDVEMDTVMVNPGQEILFLNAGLYGGVLSNDKRYFYNFNHTDFALEKIDLDNLKFEKKIEVEKPEGSLVPQASGAELSLTIYDKDLNQIAESRIPSLSQRPSYHFQGR